MHGTLDDRSLSAFGGDEYPGKLGYGWD